MTPEREAYLSNCSKTELLLRAFVADAKIYIGKLKRDLKKAGNFGREVDLILIKQNKSRLNAYRHELARLKGMNRVVIPKRSQKAIYRIGEGFKLSKVGRCNCGANLTEVLHVYCPTCGRRILWDKVK